MELDWPLDWIITVEEYRKGVWRFSIIKVYIKNVPYISKFILTMNNRKGCTLIIADQRPKPMYWICIISRYLELTKFKV